MKLMKLRTAITIALTAAVTAGLAACAPGAGGQGQQGSMSLTVGLSYTPDIQFSPFYVAAERGYFEQEGLQVELRHHGEAEEIFGALANGTEQVVFAGGDEIVQARSMGTDVLSIGTLYNSYPAALIVPEDAPIRTAEDIRGRVIGTPGPYGQTYFALLALLRGAGLSPQDVRIEHIGYTQQAALTTGKVDAVMGYVNNDAVRFAQAGFPVRTISPFQGGGQSLVGPALGASSSVVQAQPEALAALERALARAMQDIVSDPRSVIPDAAVHIPTLVTPEAEAGALATLQATVPLLERVGERPWFQNDPAVWREMVQFMREQELLGEVTVVAEDAYRNDFLPAG